jgi:hypothetical protein
VTPSPVSQASETNDVAGIMASLSPDAELVSPLSGRMVFRGGDDLEHLAVYGSMRGMRWRKEIADGSRRVVLGDCRIGPFRMSDAIVLELDGQGQIRRIRPHLRG